MKLNIGAGNKRYPGWTGVDMVARSGADIIAPADKIPLPDGSVEAIMAIHIIEHAHYWEAPKILKEWARLLMTGGKLIMEQPDLMKCCRNILEGRQGKHPHGLGIFGIFGDYRLEDSLMCHKAGYDFAMLSKIVAAAGFVNITEHETEYHRVGRGVRDFRLEALRA